MLAGCELAVVIPFVATNVTACYNCLHCCGRQLLLLILLVSGSLGAFFQSALSCIFLVKHP
eukprot:5962474-Pleurochrysis_carterae.AAC.1